jgi:uncharacterized repeat protein (TIGR01451 family)
MRKHLRLIVLIVTVLGLALGNRGGVFALPGAKAADGTAGGTAIVNSVSATYTDPAGLTYSTVSNTVQTTVAMIGAVVVSPKQTAANPAVDSAPAGTIVRTFAIANTSNITDAYTITAASCAPGSVASIAYLTAGGSSIPVTVGSTVSPSVVAGGTIVVQVTCTTTGQAVGAQIPVTLTAQTTVAGTTNGLQSDPGKQWIVIAVGPNLGVAKTVDRTTTASAEPGSTVTFDISANNSGGSPATNVVVTDPVPAGLTADVTSVKINGVAAGGAATLTGNTLTVRIPSLAPGASDDVSFDAAVSSAQAVGLTFVNVATVSSDGIPPRGSPPASVVTGSANIVFDGYGGASDPIGGATITLLDPSGLPVSLSSTVKHVAANGTAINTQNPFVTGPNGEYDFALSAANIGSGTTFMLAISAPNYLNRRISLAITPGSGDPLYNVKATSLDNQPLAVAGGFTLTSTNVSLDNIFGFFGNLPLFTARTLVVTKNVDRQVAQPGDRLAYSIDIQNTSASTIGTTQIVDTLPAGLAYAPGTAKLDGVALEPTINGRTLTWTLPTIAPSSDHTLTYICVVYPSVTAGTNLVNTVSVSGLVPGTNVTTSANSSVSVQIVGSAFSDRQVITGRVFVDAMKSGRFRRGDTGVSGVRVFLEDGSSVVTDSQGRFSFPAARPGMHVLRVDPTTLPLGIHPYDGYPLTSTRSPQQLVHGIMDDGLMEDVEFAMAPQ